MGAWGHGAYDNDAAGDFCDSVLNWKLIRKVSNYKYNECPDEDADEVRACSQLLIDFAKITGNLPPFEIIENFIIYLKLLVKNKEWLEDWSRPDLVKKDINKTIRKLDNLL